MTLPQKKRATLALSDGTVERGIAIGYDGTTGGELCFNTSMMGYQEIFTDPSYYGQLMMMTYPHIGNYGASNRDDESRKVMIAGLIVRSYSWEYSNPMADSDLDAYLKRNKIVGISGVDTRKLVRHIRTKGVMNAIISTEETDEEVLVKKARNWVSMKGLELATKVTRDEAQTIRNGGNFRVAAIDFGIKQNIINNLINRGCNLRVFPAKATYEEIMQWEPDGFFLSNGPGDPNATAKYALDTISQMKATGKPIFGICLGHQLMALSEGISVSKMFVGHRGANHPVQHVKKRLVEITTQNHGFAVDPDSVLDDKAEITHINLNDNTVEGLAFKRFNGFSVQYHPEASPGPHDSSYLFDEFISRIEEAKSTASVK
ncbi:MAG TPA: glutamine-hydrolyzing carbamoyl-phosphate synthase small subunit [Balneolales bacterium]|nr:glutamine-hydrolyzing carbamoyl-phosphate synthase small subunit [Balneolales bacterium]